MSKTVLALFAACVGLSLLSLHLVKQMRAGQATIAGLQAQVAKLESERQNNPPPSTPSSAPKATWQVEPVTSPPAIPNKELVMGTIMKRPRASASEEATMANVPSREERMRMMRESRERQRQLMQDPDYREAVRVQQRSNMTRQYPGVAQELGLTADQAEQLFDLLAEQQMRNNEQAQLVWEAEDLDPAAMQQRQEKMQQRWAEMQQKSDAELAAQLGPDKLQAWKEYQSTLGARHQAEQLRSTLASRGVPLNEDASRAVVKAYAEAQKAEMQDFTNMARANATSSGNAGLTGRLYAVEPSANMFQRQIEHTQKRNQRVLEALSPFLSYEQREALQKEQEAELKMQEAQMRIMRAQSSVDDPTNSGWVGSAVQTVILPNQ
jgi:hypothetical protein